MSTPSSASASLRPAALPPTLQPHAIASMAPPTSRGLSALVSFGCYALLGGAGFAALHLKGRGPVVRPIPPSVPVELIEHVPSRPPVVATQASSAKVDSLKDETHLQPPPTVVPGEQIPEATPVGFSNADHALDSVAVSNQKPGTSNTLVTANTGEARSSNRSGTEVAELSQAQVRVLSQVQPVYPHMARLTRIQGPVVLRMTIDASGIPTDVQVSSGHTALQTEAVRAAKLWRFSPALVNGQPTAATFQLTILFSLR